MSRLNEKDLELLQTGQTVNLSAVENSGLAIQVDQMWK